MSLHELKHDKRKILHLFPSRDHHLAMEAVIEEKCDGTIFVDRKENPRTAAVWCAPGNEAQLYLAGASDNTSFNTGLHDFFVDTIKPESINRGLNAFQAYCRDPWEKSLPVIFKDETIFKDKDSYYVLNAAAFKTLQPDWRETIPHGFTIKRVETEKVFAVEGVSAFNRLTSWKSFEQFLKEGFAYYVEEDATQKIVSGCITKFATSSGCELAVGTHEQYRRRRFATLATCAVIEETLKKGLPIIWECYHGNIPSIRTNQKVGFEYVCDEYFYLGFLYESVQKNLFSGYYYLTKLDDPEEAALWFKKGIALSKKENKSISGNYNFYAACAFAATEEYDLVFERLNAAVDITQDPKQLYHQLQTEKAFDGLRESPAFKKVLQRLEEK
jgi:RimJ/RimL family protein N-acetyltransferase